MATLFLKIAYYHHKLLVMFVIVLTLVHLSSLALAVMSLVVNVTEQEKQKFSVLHSQIVNGHLK